MLRVQIFDAPPPPRAPRPRWRSFRTPRPHVSLPGFLRRPLTWVVGAEAAVTVAFVLAALHLLSRSVAAAGVGAPSQPPLAAPSSTPSAPAAVAPRVASPPPHPGLGRSSAFLGSLLSGLNHDQAASEHEQWSALQALSGAIRAYLEDVVLPAVERAARSGRSP